jgi:anti-sigma factor ChrR (cupin superfamily)
MGTTAQGAVGPKRRSRGCRVVRQRLVCIEELPKEEAAAVRAHVELCRECGRTERFFGALVAAIRDAPMPEPRDPSWDRMVEAIMARIRTMPAKAPAIGLRDASRSASRGLPKTPTAPYTLHGEFG